MLTNFSKIKSHLIIGIFFLPILLIPVLSLAQPIGLENPIGVDSISGLIRIVVKVIRYVAIPFVVIMIMYVGFLYLWNSLGSGGGDKMKEVHSKLWWVIVGCFVILSAELIATVMENTIKTLGR